MKKPRSKKEPTKQLNLRLSKVLIAGIKAIASERQMKPSQVFLAIIEDATRNRCLHCRGGLVEGASRLHPKVCNRCYGTGRVDIAKRIRAAERSRRAQKRKAHKKT